MPALRDSGNLEQDADTVFLLYREEQTKMGQVYPVEVIIAKQRNGPDGQVTLGFHRSCMRFENWALDATVVDRLWESGLQDASHAGS
jgi:replicative DNA helicase